MRLDADSSIEVDEYVPARQSLRIAVVTETYPPEVNGVAVTIASFVEGLRARNHVIQLVRPRQAKAELGNTGERFHEVLLGGMPIPNYPHLKMGLPSKRELVRLWSQRRPDLVHVVTEGPLGWSAVQAAATLRLPVCSDFRTNFHSYSRHYRIGWLQRPILAYLRKFHNRTRFTMVPTEALRRDLAAVGFRNLRVVARGVDTKRFSPEWRSEDLRRSWGVDPQMTVALHVGRLAPEKNLAALVETYDALQLAQPQVRMVIVGDGPSRKDMERRCPKAIFAGMRSGEDLSAHYASGDVFLFPSLTETFGNVTTEAMASGLAVVAYDYAAASQLIASGVSGMLARFENSPEFVRHALALAANPVAAATLGKRAREVAEAHSWDRVVEQLETMLIQLVSAPEGQKSDHLSVLPPAISRRAEF
jgi:glycosyltransferase involved in cell wall biosynthesis